jgi:Ni,Fe-hydrogenase maturation factor
MNCYVFGNSLIEEDSLPLKIMDRLQLIFPEIKFVTVDPNEDFPPKNEKKLLIIDTIINIKKPSIFVIDDLEKVKKTPVSPHDYDLLFHLFLAKKLNKIESAQIIGLPTKINQDEAIEQTSILLKKIIAT